MGKLAAILVQWPALDTLLDEALTLPPDARRAWLHSQQGLPAAQRDALRELLGLDAKPAQLIDELPSFELSARDSPNAPATLATGQLIGPYRLISRLGEGGMGSVWLAERADQQLRRRVAIKLPHVGWASDMVARLQRERDILASLEHPNIARLYDAGIDQMGRPYLAMEYVDGTSITEYCNIRGLELRAKLDLVRAAAAAVAYAHTRLVVHRDLKPSNILVTQSGDVRLLDFGIAKFLQPDTADVDLTKISGQAVTPDYSSPEQFRGEAIGTPSDVYSLGVVTYELLAGVRPYRIKDVQSARLDEAIMRVQPVLLSRAPAERSVRKQLRGDLEAILNKALKKGAAERYQTIAEFSADIGRYMNGLPIHARPDSLGYRTGKFIARNALPVGAAGLVIMAILAGTSIALWQAHQARVEAARADQVKEFVLSIFADADTDSGAGAGTTAAELLTSAQARVETELPTRPDVAVELMTAIAYGLLGQDRVSQALQVCEKALALAAANLGPDHPRTITASVVYGEALLDNGESARAVAVLTPAIDAARRINARADLASALQQRSAANVELNQLVAAVADAKAAVAALPTPVSKAEKVAAANIYGQLANALSSSQQAGASTAARRTVALAREAFGDQQSEAAVTALNTLAKALESEGNYLGAIDAASNCIAEINSFFGPNYRLMPYALGNLSLAQWRVGEIGAAIETRQKEIEFEKHRSGDQSYALGIAYSWLARYLMSAHRDAEAQAIFHASYESLRAAGPQYSTLIHLLQSHQALSLARFGRLTESESLFNELAAYIKPPGEQYAIHQSHEAELRSLQGRHEQAIQLAQFAAVALSASDVQQDTAEANLALGRVLLAANRPGEAVAPLSKAVQFYRTQQRSVTPDQSLAIGFLATAERLRASSTPLKK